MKRLRQFFRSLVALSLGWLGLSGGVALAGQAEDEAAIRQSVESYTAAFNKQDAKTLAAHWSPEAVYTNPVSGEEVTGREAIEKQFEGIFGSLKGAKLETSVESIRFVSPNVAVENGTARVTGADGKPQESSYTAVHVKRDGKWLLDRVTEEDIPEIVSNYDKLKELEWMIGTWVDEDEQSKVETTCQWSKNRNFIVRTSNISVRDQVDFTGMQVIGWDPAAKKIRSWVFDTDGGFGEGVWTKKGNRWYVQAKDTSADGRKMSSQNIITMVDRDSFTWQSVDRQAGDQLLPNVDEVLVVRKTVDGSDTNSEGQ
jgi:uncharacterized protein (TIGR02246 family)